jgi:hypothetical protein
MRDVARGVGGGMESPYSPSVRKTRNLWCHSWKLDVIVLLLESLVASFSSCQFNYPCCTRVCTSLEGDHLICIT